MKLAMQQDELEVRISQNSVHCMIAVVSVSVRGNMQ